MKIRVALVYCVTVDARIARPAIQDQVPLRLVCSQVLDSLVSVTQHNSSCELRFAALRALAAKSPLDQK